MQVKEMRRFIDVRHPKGGCQKSKQNSARNTKSGCDWHAQPLGSGSPTYCMLIHTYVLTHIKMVTCDR
ncbi:hypothetical protein NEUTE1DRAFT_118101 [Neurospora tetrasperma FGSC 2508]|uniref:Uncharacterized protein n=1 Tax=Neurospora tetrasperma (strain FGSC 2508 / ATCC MYA-4615 / P0657) TaxID=510951 RepID=F8MWT5_NEUT8|nr:uncharacterized protein NEUTE1DRAFT_118101 [Neurospora tetrasperma FGSC 2508]EGO54206.1 hypothetical protein NEUTE1DRAFT_118101 [Neurospora tetrasperma FGSC 2508]EGZ68362.1 hypothetical protein NEUTE2DRAFT_145932 [Neurospora tetrasperma FGSC 2509]